MKNLGLALIILIAIQSISYSATISDKDSDIYVKVLRNTNHTFTFYKCEKDPGHKDTCRSLGRKKQYTNTELEKEAKRQRRTIAYKSVAIMATIATFTVTGAAIGFGSMVVTGQAATSGGAIAAGVLGITGAGTGMYSGFTVGIKAINPMANFYRARYLDNADSAMDSQVDDINNYVDELESGLNNIR